MASSTIGTMSDEGYTISAPPISFPISSATLRWHGGITAHQECPVVCNPVAQFQGRRRRKYGNVRKEEKVNGQTQCEQYDISGSLDFESDAGTEAVSDFWKETEASVEVQGHEKAGPLVLVEHMDRKTKHLRRFIPSFQAGMRRPMRRRTLVFKISILAASTSRRRQTQLKQRQPNNTEPRTSNEHQVAIQLAFSESCTPTSLRLRNHEYL